MVFVVALFVTAGGVLPVVAELMVKVTGFPETAMSLMEPMV